MRRCQQDTAEGVPASGGFRKSLCRICITNGSSSAFSFPHSAPPFWEKWSRSLHRAPLLRTPACALASFPGPNFFSPVFLGAFPCTQIGDRVPKRTAGNPGVFGCATARRARGGPSGGRYTRGGPTSPVGRPPRCTVVAAKWRHPSAASADLTVRVGDRPVRTGAARTLPRVRCSFTSRSPERPTPGFERTVPMVR